MAITTQMRTQVSQLYVALFGRAPDGDGLGFWVQKLGNGESFASVAQQMYNVEPARAYYPLFLTNEEIIGRFYTNVLGRTADAEGLAFWTAKLNTAGATPGSVIAEMITTVATYTGTDAAGIKSANLFNNKAAVAEYYGMKLGGVAGATSALNGVTDDAATVTAAKTAIDTPAPVAGVTLPLTTGVDTTLVGGAGNDTYTATNLTLTSGDQLNGGAGTDTLQVTTTALATLGGGVISSNVENVVATATQGTLTLALDTFAGVSSVTTSGSTADVVVTGVAAIPTVNATATNNSLTVTPATTATVGTNDSATINLTGVATTASNSVTVNGVENITVNATGTSGSTAADGVTTTRTTIGSDGLLKSVTIGGTGTAKLNVSMTGAQTGTTGSAATITGSAGADDLQITLPAAASKLSANMGAGDDMVRLASINAAQTIAGSDGTDTLVYTGTGAAAATATANLTGFEKVVIAGPGSVALATSDVTYTVAGGSTTYTGLASGGTLNLQAGGTVTLTNTALTGATDSITVNVGKSGSTGTTAATNTSSVTANLVETVTVNFSNISTALATDSNAATISGDTLKTVVITSPVGATLPAAARR